MIKPLLIGEDNPYSLDERFALYPHPERSAGYRLAVDILGLYRKTYLEAFDRTNLCTGRWSMEQARLAAAAILRVRGMVPGAWMILCGAKVCRAFGLTVSLDARPVEAWNLGARGMPPDPTRSGIVVIPHPSGRCRIWGRTGVIDEVRATLAAICPGVPFGEVDAVGTLGAPDR